MFICHCSENSHRTLQRAAQQRIWINVWAGILRDYLIGPYLLPLDGRVYLIFLQCVLLELLDAAHVPPSLLRKLSSYSTTCSSTAFLVLVLRDYLIGPYLFPSILVGRVHLIFWQEVMQTLLDAAHVPLPLLSTMWYQHDRDYSTLRKSRPQNNSSETFGQWSIDRGDMVHWPDRSPNLSCMDFFFWSHMKT
ncbi:uncharacterized protein TNCT_292991 [Trichonephila clavata]|uniref:Uncharacterized protein n=1 Tax=Trichonephila clavata TaxID=2740835 RepID=A0A8X6HWL0_TRICU|nr:uncharacterized protein TNCT_292991 [Trichonephila clavata]